MHDTRQQRRFAVFATALTILMSVVVLPTVVQATLVPELGPIIKRARRIIVGQVVDVRPVTPPWLGHYNVTIRVEHVLRGDDSLLEETSDGDFHLTFRWQSSHGEGIGFDRMELPGPRQVFLLARADVIYEPENWEGRERPPGSTQPDDVILVEPWFGAPGAGPHTIRKLQEAGVDVSVLLKPKRTSFAILAAVSLLLVAVGVGLVIALTLRRSRRRGYRRPGHRVAAGEG